MEASSSNRHICSASWQKQVAKHKPGLTEADIRERTPSDSSLACPIDNKLFRDAVKTPCCGTLYCEECVQTHLLERDFICPKCGAKIASLDKLIMDKPMRTKVADYIDKEIEKSRHEPQEEPKSSGTPEPTTNKVRTSPMLLVDLSRKPPAGESSCPRTIGQRRL